MKTILLSLAILLTCAFLSVAKAGTPTSGPSLLPSGYLITSGNQITDLSGHDVRLACVGYDQPGLNIQAITADEKSIKADGFNCMRFSWYDATIDSDLPTAVMIVDAASSVGLKVILDHHGDETPNKCNHYIPYNANGLPIDKGPGTDGNDGWLNSNGTPCDKSTVNIAKYTNDWVRIAKRFAGNSTVIGFDLDNEPHFYGNGYPVDKQGANWGPGTPNDLRVIYEDVGDAIELVDPGVLIIAEGPLNYSDNLFDGDINIYKGFPDLTGVKVYPVYLTYNYKLVYSIHDYPRTIGGTHPDSGPDKVAAMNTGWGFLLSQQSPVPVWVGEMGASLDDIGRDSEGTNKQGVSRLIDEQHWAHTMVQYLNGDEAKGPRFTGCETGIGTDWWAWGNFDTFKPDGTLTDSGTPRPQQQVITQQLTFIPAPGC